MSQRALPAEEPLALASAHPKTPSRWRTRLGDRHKWPRKWWWPLPNERALLPEDWKKQHDEISKAINKLLLVLIGFCFFCGLALGTPDESLLASNAKVTLPFANADISFVAFLVIAPVVLTALSFYLHIFVGYWLTLSRQQPMPPTLPFVFNLPYRTAERLSNFLFYWLVPIMLAVFTWKALPRPEAPRLIALTSMFVAVFIFLRLRRRSNQTLKIATFLLWAIFLCDVPVAAVTAALVLVSSLNHDFIVVVPGRQLHLQKADLNKQDLRNLNLGNADLSNANLAEANLGNADLSNANLTEANLGGAKLITAQLMIANLGSADLSNANLTGANLANANLTNANLTNANLTYAFLANADLSNANLSNAALIHATLVDADLSNANLTNANLTNANLTGANLANANLVDTYLAGAKLVGAKHLTMQQVNETIRNQTTTLPTGITEPPP